MSSRHFPVADRDAGHEFPLAPQGNIDHVPMKVVLAPGTTDKIIQSGAPQVGKNSNPVWQFPADNKASATEEAA